MSKKTETNKQKLYLIVGMGEKNEIGQNGTLPWRLPNDLKTFKKITEGNIVIMGKNTFQSLPKGPLPNRMNIVITTTLEGGEGYEVVPSIKDALLLCKEKYSDISKIFFIGGNQIYQEALKLVDAIYLTQVKSEFPEADTFFPHFPRENWLEVTEHHYPMDDKHDHLYSISLLISKKKVATLLPKRGDLTPADIDWLEKHQYQGDQKVKHFYNELRYYFGDVPSL